MLKHEKIIYVFLYLSPIYFIISLPCKYMLVKYAFTFFVKKMVGKLTWPGETQKNAGSCTCNQSHQQQKTNFHDHTINKACLQQAHRQQSLCNISLI